MKPYYVTLYPEIDGALQRLLSDYPWQSDPTPYAWPQQQHSPGTRQRRRRKRARQVRQ